MINSKPASRIRSNHSFASGFGLGWARRPSGPASSMIGLVKVDFPVSLARLVHELLELDPALVQLLRLLRRQSRILLIPAAQQLQGSPVLRALFSSTLNHKYLTRLWARSLRERSGQRFRLTGGLSHRSTYRELTCFRAPITTKR